MPDDKPMNVDKGNNPRRVEDDDEECPEENRTGIEREDLKTRTEGLKEKDDSSGLFFLLFLCNIKLYIEGSARTFIAYIKSFYCFYFTVKETLINLNPNNYICVPFHRNGDVVQG